ncbi:MAG: hypothetical protein ACOYNI_00085 [Acidimicrobiia bacterium]
MSRLIDRLRTFGARPSRLADFMRDPDNAGPLVQAGKLAPVGPDGSRFPGLAPNASDYQVGAAVDRYELEQQRARRAPRIETGNLDVHAIASDWVPKWLAGIDRHLLEAVPPLARPYDEFWIETQVPGFKYLDFQRYHSWGAKVSDFDLAQFRAVVDVVDGSDPSALVDGEAFAYQMDLYVEPTKDDIVFLGAIAFATDKIGDVLRLDAMGAWAIPATSYNNEINITAGLEADNLLTVGGLTRPLLATWAFLNLEKGVERVTRDPSEKLAKKFRKQHGGALGRYEEVTLTDDLRRVVEDALRSGQSFAQALHTVRGHNVTYTPERPMFGIPGRHGTVHKGSYLRGSAEVGTVEKDYVVNAPRTVASDGPEHPQPGSAGGVGR